MIIGIDITMLVYSGSGVASYTYNLVKALLEVDKKNKYRLFYSSFHQQKNCTYLKEFEKLGAKIYNYRIPFRFLQFCWGKLNIIPVEWLIGKVDCFLSSDFLRPPLLESTHGVTTVHDLVWKIYPQFHQKNIIEAHKIKLEKTIKYQDTILTDSICTKKDLIKYFPEVNKEKIHVVYPGIGEEFQPILDKNKIKKVLAKYFILDTEYLLYVGAIEPRKNLDLAIEVFHDLITNHQPPTTNLKFIIAGKAGWKNENIFQKISDLNLKDKVKLIGYVDDEDLPYLYNAASLTVYLSTYEGFGLPPLESMACGTSVIVGDNSSLKETVDKKFLVDVNDKNEVIKKTRYLLENKVNVDSELIRKRFNWQEYARNFLKVIDSENSAV